MVRKVIRFVRLSVIVLLALIAVGSSALAAKSCLSGVETWLIVSYPRGPHGFVRISSERLDSLIALIKDLSQTDTDFADHDRMGPSERQVSVYEYRGGLVWLETPLWTEVKCPMWMVALAASIYPAIAFIRGPLRWYRRRKRGLCVRCGYDLTGNVSAVCPECGRPCS